MRKLLPIVLAALVIMGAVIAIRDADPGVREARAAQARAQAAEAAARAEAAQVWAAEWAERAPERAAALTWAAIGLLGVLVITAAGVSIALIIHAHLRAQIAGRMVHADRNAIYPAIMDLGGGWTMLNEPRAQTLAALAAAAPRRPTAAMVGRVLDASPALPEPAPLPEIPSPAELYPHRVEIYQAPLPAELALPVGVDGRGRPLALPLRNLGNVLIGGLPGTGKSELLASMLAGLLRQDATGERVQVAVIDPKMVDLGNIPDDLAGLRWPVATDIDEAHALVDALVAEVRRRFSLLHGARARTIDAYVQATGEPMPYLVAMIDELADMTCDERQRAALFVQRAMEIGRKGRAAGVSLVMATQRPSSDVVPSSLRNLAGAAVAFRVSRNHDSVAILGETGAEQLPAIPGRCLVRQSDTVRAQSYVAGLTAGRFDAFVASLPRGAIAAPAWPRSTAIPGAIPANTGPESGIPGFSTDDRAAYTAEQIAHIRSLHARLGSIKAVERALYGQDGGYWFYRLQEVLS